MSNAEMMIDLINRLIYDAKQIISKGH